MMTMRTLSARSLANVYLAQQLWTETTAHLKHSPRPLRDGILQGRDVASGELYHWRIQFSPKAQSSYQKSSQLVVLGTDGWPIKTSQDAYEWLLTQRGKRVFFHEFGHFLDRLRWDDGQDVTDYEAGRFNTAPEIQAHLESFLAEKFQEHQELLTTIKTAPKGSDPYWDAVQARQLFDDKSARDWLLEFSRVRPLFWRNATPETRRRVLKRLTDAHHQLPRS